MAIARVSNKKLHDGLVGPTGNRNGKQCEEMEIKRMGGPLSIASEPHDRSCEIMTCHNVHLTTQEKLRRERILESLFLAHKMPSSLSL